jgi:L-iditol 2-dehydrogenase
MTTIPETMKAAVYYNNEDVRLTETPIPALEAGDLLVRMEACGLCTGETAEEYQLPRGPRVQGHEPTGVVVDCGPGPNPFKVGDRIFVHHHVPCMSCHFCNRGHYTMCDHWPDTGLDPGGFAEYFRVPAENVRLDTLRLPDPVSFEAGTIIEPMGCTLRGLRQTPIHPGDTVAIVGSGFMGLCFVQLARLWPVGEIIALDLNDWRLQKARELGADETINPSSADGVEAVLERTHGRGADAVFVSAGSLRALELGMALCAKGATLHLNAPPPKGTPWKVNGYELFFHEIKMNSAYSATHLDTRAVLDLLAAGRVRAEPLITHRFGLDRIDEAIHLILDQGESIKSVVIPGLTGQAS